MVFLAVICANDECRPEQFPSISEAEKGKRVNFN